MRIVIDMRRQLGGERKQLLAEAAATLAIVSAAVRVLPFKRAITLGAIPLGRRRQSNVDAEECVAAIEAAARRLPWRIVCIHKGIAAQRLMRRRGIGAKLHYGIAKGRKPDRLEAHVWVSVNGGIVIGGEEARAFAPVAAYP